MNSISLRVGKILSVVALVAVVLPSLASAQTVINIFEDAPRSEATVFTGSGGAPGSEPTVSDTGGGSFGGPGTDACQTLRTGGFVGVVDCIMGFINYFIYVLIALVVVYTVVGAFNMIGSEDKREEGKQRVYYGIIALFAIMSIWGLVNVLNATFNLANHAPVTPRPLNR